MTTVVQHVTAEATDQLKWSRVGPEVTKTQVDCWSFCAGLPGYLEVEFFLLFYYIC